MNYYSPFDEISKFPNHLYFPNSKPIFLKCHEISSKIVICLHGFTATPFETLPVAQAIIEKKMDAACVLFPGHGIINKKVAQHEMGKYSFQDQLNVVKNEIERARKRYDQVFIYGQSMGGAVALAMAEEHLVDAVACTAPAIKLPRHGELAAIFLGWLNLNKKKSPENNSFFNECYDFINLHSVGQLNCLAHLVRKRLHQIQCPVLECHSHKDYDITPKIAEWIKKEAQGKVEIRWFNESGHTMPLDIQGKEVSATIAQFFSEL